MQVITHQNSNDSVNKWLTLKGIFNQKCHLPTVCWQATTPPIMEEEVHYMKHPTVKKAFPSKPKHIGFQK